MKARVSIVALVFSGLIIFAGCARPVRLPEKLLGVWYEQQREATLGDEAGKFENLSGMRNILRFEQEGESAFVYGGEVINVGDNPERWSVPYALKQVGDNSWSFERNGREIIVGLGGDGQLRVKGLVIRNQVTGFEKDANGSFKPSQVESRPIESIFVRKQ